MTNLSICFIREASIVTLSLLGWQLAELSAQANPLGGTGPANIVTSGSTETITTSSSGAVLNWSSFNINAGETTTFVEPSSSSVVWNNINGGSPSQILGNLNANGYVILDNQAGFFVGGAAAITAHGLILSTASSAAPNVSGGGAWTFNAPPPTAQIINFGQINITGGGSAFLIANNIVNEGTISAPQGKIGLYAGEQVLVSTSPDGRGLNAKVTLPQGSVDNEGHLIADGGTIAAQAQTVNQNGTIQANSVQNINGVIELVASDSLTLGASSDIEANGDSTSPGPSQAGFVVLQSGNTYADTATSMINVAGQNGGQDGVVEIFGQGTVQSSIPTSYATLINPYDLTISFNPTDASANPTGTPFNFNNSGLAAYSQIDLRALDNIELSAPLTLTDPGAPAQLSLQAGNSIILDNSTGISADNNWQVNLTAGTGFVPTAGQPAPAPGSLLNGIYNDGIYLAGNAFIQTQNGDINVWAANEVQINDDIVTADGNGIRTLNGGNINVTAQYGDVNAGGSTEGFDFNGQVAPFYTASSELGGISTAAGGNVTIHAGGNVTSFLPDPGNTTDAGTGAFGPEAGNVTITAGGSIFGHYVLANGVGTLTAGGDIGTESGVDSFALSLINGTWNVNAGGNIFLQEVRNPNGIFNNLTGGTRGHPSLAGQHLFNYGADATVDLTAGDGVTLTGLNLPRLDNTIDNVQVLYPPILDITAGAGGVTLEGNVTLFPSPDQNLNITTTDGGSLQTPTPTTGVPPVEELLMSDSAQNRWVDASTFSDTDHGPLSSEPTDPNPVSINISGNMEDITLVTTKETQLTVGGDMINCGFSGQNLHASDTTSITVGGQIFSQSAFAFIFGVTIPSVPAADLLPGLSSSWDSIFFMALNPSTIAALTVPPGTPTSQYLTFAVQSATLFGANDSSGQWVVAGGDQGFVYNTTTGRLGFGGVMPQNIETALTGPITVLHLVNGQPVLDANGHFETDTINWAPASDIKALSDASQNDPSPSIGQLGYRIGGPGQFDINAGSISLGNSFGILSGGTFDTTAGFNRYGNLASITPEGATINVTVSGDLDMLTSTIATLGGGNVNVTSTGGSMDLGSEELFNTSRQVGFGVFTAGAGNVSVIAAGDIDIDGSRVAAYDGGSIFVESLTGGVDVGTGGNTPTGVVYSYVNPVTGQPGFYAENVFGNGIVANTLVPGTASEGFPPGSVPVATVPGNITVQTPQGDITASLGGITQVALDGTTTAGPTITLIAGSPAVGNVGDPDYFPGFTGNIDLGQSGVIGGTVNATANGNITGLIIARQNANIHASQNVVVSVLAGGQADVDAGGDVSGIIVGAGGANVSGDSVTAAVLGQNVSVNGGASQSTLGSSASATSTSQSAAQQASNDTKQELANTDDSDDDKKNHKVQPLMQRVKRVTVILPKASAEKAEKPQG